MSKKPLEGLLVELISQRRLKMAKISYFYNEIQLLFKSHLNWRFEILGVDKQMFISCDQVDPHRSPKNAYFNSVIGIYFLSFYEHPVVDSPYWVPMALMYLKILKQ